LDAVRQLQSQQVRWTLNSRLQHPAQLLIFQADAVHGVERAEDVFIGTQAQSTQKDRAQKLALAVNADIDDVLLVVLKFHPGSAIGNDLAQEICGLFAVSKKTPGERCNWLT